MTRRIRVLVNALPCLGSDGSDLVANIAAWAGQEDRIELHALIRQDQIAACSDLNPNIRVHALDHRCSIAATRLFLGLLTRQMSADVLISPPDLGALLAGCKVFWISSPNRGLAAWVGLARRLVLDITRRTAHDWVDGSLSHLRPR